MKKGKIIEIYTHKGYGFVKEIASGIVLPFNTADLYEPISQNEDVVFNMVDLDPGKLAINLKKIQQQ
ncbi:MAG: hypothetical protein PF694_02210 [Bacteroidetes bacterium]|jgi:hypothetical protein|nr:hypothetical protein [Bacteroidota bacterium]